MFFSMHFSHYTLLYTPQPFYQLGTTLGTSCEVRNTWNSHLAQGCYKVNQLAALRFEPVTCNSESHVLSIWPPCLHHYLCHHYCCWHCHCCHLHCHHCGIIITISITAYSMASLLLLASQHNYHCQHHSIVVHMGFMMVVSWHHCQHLCHSTVTSMLHQKQTCPPYFMYIPYLSGTCIMTMCTYVLQTSQ